MSTPDEEFLDELEVEVDVELTAEESARPPADEPVGSWQFDPTDIDREEASLRSLRGAIEALEGGGIPPARG
ncbi:hypothetical protein GCM10009554_11730 [Kribbella koreensis]|uniref:Uncharacterized protein n=2 Tax=Kribbella TaxID=182639 RepID=A0ABP6YCG6_9ACTN